jgi:ribosomal protein S18 acetylase RimI-like enzyme
MTVSFRLETGADEPFLRRLITSTIVEELGAGAWPEPMRTHLAGSQYQIRRSAVRLHFPAGESRIVMVDGEDAGWLYTANLEHEVRLVEIMIGDAARGKGAGTAVIRYVIASSGDKPVRLYVNVMNDRAVRLYQRLGFRRVGGDELQHLMERPSC